MENDTGPFAEKLVEGYHKFRGATPVPDSTLSLRPLPTPLLKLTANHAVETESMGGLWGQRDRKTREEKQILNMSYYRALGRMHDS